MLPSYHVKAKVHDNFFLDVVLGEGYSSYTQEITSNFNPPGHEKTFLEARIAIKVWSGHGCQKSNGWDAKIKVIYTELCKFNFAAEISAI